MKKVAGWVVGVIFFVAMGALGYEGLVWVTRTPEKTKAIATQRFLEECARHHLEPKDFDGPHLIREGDPSSGFTWRRKENGDQIFVSVDYLPIGSESWYLPAPQIN